MKKFVLNLVILIFTIIIQQITSIRFISQNINILRKSSIGGKLVKYKSKLRKQNKLQK